MKLRLKCIMRFVSCDGARLRLSTATCGLVYCPKMKANMSSILENILINRVLCYKQKRNHTEQYSYCQLLAFNNKQNARLHTGDEWNSCKVSAVAQKAGWCFIGLITV
jgi:hypothetical protein